MKRFVGVCILSLCIVPLFSQVKKSKQTPKEELKATNTVEKKTTAVQSDTSDPMLRRKAINDIVFSRDNSKVDVVAGYLNDENKLVKMAAIEGLGILRSTKNEDNIVDILINDTDREIKNSCIVALSYLYPLKNIDKITNYYFKENDEFIKGQIIRLLALKNVKTLEKEMINLISSNKTSNELKLNAIYYLGVIKSTQSVPIIRNFINDSNKLIKLEAIRSIGEIADTSSIELLRARVGENDDDVKLESALALSKMGDPFGLDYMYKYIDSPNLSYRDKALTVIGAVGNTKSISILEDKLKNVTDPNLKSFISFTIEKIKARLKFSDNKK